VTPHEIDIVLISELLRVRRFVPDQAQSRNATALLVNGDDWFGLAQVAQIIDKLSELSGALDVPTEKNESPWLHPPKQLCRFCVQFFAGHASHDQLTE
jgi:hypothetical protein